MSKPGVFRCAISIGFDGQFKPLALAWAVGGAIPAVDQLTQSPRVCGCAWLPPAWLRVTGQGDR